MGVDRIAQARARVSELIFAGTEWSEKAKADITELDRLRSEMGGAVVDDPTAAGSYVERIATLDALVQVAEAAARAVGPKLDEARRDVLRAEIEQYDAEAKRATTVLAKHEAKTAELLQQLQEHDGDYVPAYVERPIGAEGEHRIVQKATKATPLRTARDLPQLRARVLRMLLEGEDPRPMVEARASIVDGSVLGVPVSDFWPKSVWGPEAIWSISAAVAAASAEA